MGNSIIHVDGRPSSAMEVLELMPFTRTELDVFTDQVIEAVKGGNANPLQVRAWKKFNELAFERIDKETQAEQLREADKYPGDKFEAFGCTMQKGDVRTEYDYLACGDPIYIRLQSILDSAKEQLKQREAFLKTIKSPMPIIDESTGEVVTINPPIKRSTPGLKISVK